MKCPICSFNKAIEILNHDCGNLDNSSLYQNIRINVCKNCGHVYNKLSFDEMNGLTKYYNEEYAPLNLSIIDRIGDRPGSNNSFTTQRFKNLFNFISQHIKHDSKILDVGCATGGFLNFLGKKGFKNLYGIDLIKDYVDYAQKYSYNIKVGNVYSIPFNDNSFDIVILDQVIEHLVDLKRAIIEIKRVLVNGGIVCVGVPDASRYEEIYFFEFYWFLMREHIQHFDLEHLKLLFGMEGFELIRFNKCETPIMSERMLLPNLNVLFYLNNNKKYFTLKKEIIQYKYSQYKKLHKKQQIIDDLIRSEKPVYIWGIGREFLFLYEALGLRYCNIISLIDDTPLKQEKFTVDGQKILNGSILKDASSDSVLIITATAHVDLIKEKILKIGYKGEIIDV